MLPQLTQRHRGSHRLEMGGHRCRLEKEPAYRNQGREAEEDNQQRVDVTPAATKRMRSSEIP
jgi:hypothetical protein